MFFPGTVWTVSRSIGDLLSGAVLVFARVIDDTASASTGVGRSAYDRPMSPPPPSVPDGSSTADVSECIVLFDGSVQIDYGQFYFRSSDGQGGCDFDGAFIGQRNGLCGAATPGQLVLITGPNVGDPHVRAELHTREPALDDRWEDIVEATMIVPERSAYSIVELGGDALGDSTYFSAGSYRVRYSASGTDDAHPASTNFVADSDDYLLQLWPAHTAPDRVVKQTSSSAAYWHAYFSQ